MSLFDAREPKPPKWAGERLPVAMPSDVCPRCDLALVEAGMDAPALIRYGGYGATTANRVRLCPDRECGYVGGSDSTEVRPDRAAGLPRDPPVRPSPGLDGPAATDGDPRTTTEGLAP